MSNGVNIFVFFLALLNGATPKSEFNRVNQLALEQLMYEQLEGFLLILTPTGKIVFVSHTVEQMLGHLQVHKHNLPSSIFLVNQ